MVLRVLEVLDHAVCPRDYLRGQSPMRDYGEKKFVVQEVELPLLQMKYSYHPPPFYNRVELAIDLGGY